MGCSKNLVISEKLAVSLQQNYNISNDVKNADFIIINSCGFIDEAIVETTQEVVSVYSQKNLVNNQKIILTGCAVMLFKKELTKQLPEVDLVFTYDELNDFFAIPHYEMTYSRLSVPLMDELNTGIYSRYLMISEGCSKNCTYCLIPKIKGSFRSMSEGKLVEEAKILQHSGVKEITIISQDTLSYGIDINSSLYSLVKKISELHFPWIRLLYMNADDFSPDILKIYDLPGVIPYFEMPVQHLIPKIRKLMNRHSNYPSIEDSFYAVKKAFPDSVIRTSVIVGFPQETDNDFNDMKNKLVKLPIDYCSIFPYSDMKGSASNKITKKNTSSIIKKRYNQLSEAIEKKTWENLENEINKAASFLIESIDPKNNILEGRTVKQAPLIDGTTKVRPRKSLSSYRIGDIIMIKIVEADLYDFVGDEL